jgi:Rnl2 family RNA ligase
MTEAEPHHTSYEKIVERPEQWGLDDTGYRALKKSPWVVTEKIHGANFALLSDGQAVRCARRKALLAEGEDFFGHTALLPRLVPAVLRLHREVRARHPDTVEVTLYGELFGGAYPHPDVPPVPGVQAVQTGVYYSPRVEFCAFDLAREDARGERHYLDSDVLLKLCEAEGVIATRPLFIGTYEEALEYPTGFESHVPGWFGLPPLKGNLAEGIVLKPQKDLWVPTAKGKVRPVLKHKIAEFAEDERFHGATKWKPAPQQGAWLSFEDLRSLATAFANEARLASAVSKLGPPPSATSPQAEALLELLVEDILEQLETDAGDSLRALSLASRAALDAHVRQEAEDLRTLYFELRR